MRRKGRAKRFLKFVLYPLFIAGVTIVLTAASIFDTEERRRFEGI